MSPIYKFVSFLLTFLAFTAFTSAIPTFLESYNDLIKCISNNTSNYHIYHHLNVAYAELLDNTEFEPDSKDKQLYDCSILLRRYHIFSAGPANYGQSTEGSSQSNSSENSYDSNYNDSDNAATTDTNNTVSFAATILSHGYGHYSSDCSGDSPSF